jgi:hypothetical protein
MLPVFWACPRALRIVDAINMAHSRSNIQGDRVALTV